ncbi:MAG TPA: MFS transporter [Mycobacterium sp.]|nr:MFS transporter [Mycobacterium sp.]HTX93777.1 MFS transporter [Mycobacterium sp.]
MTDTATITGGWRELLGARYLRTSILLAGGVALYATNEFLTTSLLPNTIAEIGGSRLYAWVTTLYLVGSVVAAAMVNPLLLRVGARSSYLMGLAVFGASSLICGAAPDMHVLIAGRALQGVAGGLLAGLGYAVINTALPRRLWTRGSALVSAMWGVATVVGPTTGGLFAQFGLWRWAFVAMAILTGLMATLVPIALAHADPSAAMPAKKVPVWSLLIIGAAALAVSVAQIPRNVIATFGLLGLGIALVGLFVIVDWRMHAAILPLSVFGPGPLKWMYLSMGVLMGAAMVNTYVPLFGQRLAHLNPVAAGFLGATLALGWTVSEIVSASLDSPQVIGRLIVAAPLVAASGLALGAVARSGDASIWTAALWAVALVVAGTGIGMAWPHLSARAMASVDAPAEGGAASAAINTVQLISAAVGAGLAGVVVNTAKGGDGMAAHLLFTVFTALSAAGVAVSYGATRGGREAAPGGPR